MFFDRDGVLNRAMVREGKPYPPSTVAELEIVEGAAEGLQRLKALGFLLLVATNQPDVSRGTQSREAVDEFHALMRRTLPVDEFLVCAHDDRDGCQCRKPKPGLLVDAQARYGIDMGRSYMVGDRWRDIDAGQAAGCRTVWLDMGYRERGPSQAPDATVGTLGEAVEWIIRSAEGDGRDG